MTLSAYCGVDLQVTSPCRCGCARWRVQPHSTKSDTPVWKCPWCGARKGKLTEIEIKTLKNFVRLFGWPVLPLVFHDDGYVYAYGQLSALRKAGTGVRWKDGDVSALRECDAITDVPELHAKNRSTVARRRGNAAKRESSEGYQRTRRVSEEAQVVRPDNGHAGRKLDGRCC